MIGMDIDQRLKELGGSEYSAEEISGLREIIAELRLARKLPKWVEEDTQLTDAFAWLATGYEGTYALISHFADQLAEHWHAGNHAPDYGGSLAEWMGLTEEQYAMFAEARFRDLAKTFVGQD